MKIDLLPVWRGAVWGSIPHCCKAVDSTILSLDLLPSGPVVFDKSCYVRGALRRNALIPLGNLRFGPLAFCSRLRMWRHCRADWTAQPLRDAPSSYLCGLPLARRNWNDLIFLKHSTDGVGGLSLLQIRLTLQRVVLVLYLVEPAG